MDLKLTDKVKQFNSNQRYTQKVKEKAIKKAQVEQLFENVGKGIKKVASTIPEIPGKIKEYIENKKLQAQEDQLVLDMYKYFIEYANQNTDKTGVEFNPENEDIKVIYTNFGPLFIAQLEDSENLKTLATKQAIEGFLPDDDGLLKYFNAELQTPKTGDTVTLIGFAVNPETMKVSQVNKTTNKSSSKAMFYIRKQEELAKKKTQQSQPTEQEKQ